MFAKPPTGQRQRRGIAVSIIDTGKGIRPEDAKRLFQPFFSTKSTKGTGLGLWISKGIVQKYDGRISCRSYRYQSKCDHLFPGIHAWQRGIESYSGRRRRRSQAGTRCGFGIGRQSLAIR